jgi:hypothetical protein
MKLNDYNTLFYFEIESHTDFGPLVSKIVGSTIKLMSTVYSLSTLGDQPLFSRSVSTFLLKTYDLILNILLLFTTQNIFIITMCLV